MLETATGRQFGVVMILMSIGMLSGFFILIPFGKKLSTISILMIYIPVGISEALSYTPILGSSTYLTFITGNIMNLKVPVAVNAMKLAKKEANTPEGEAISCVAVSVSSIMTVVILALVALISSRIIWKKGIIKVVDNDETASEKAE